MHDPKNDQCRETIALRSPVALECRHGYDHCPECDACTCPGAPPPPTARYADHVKRTRRRARRVVEDGGALVTRALPVAPDAHRWLPTGPHSDRCTVCRRCRLSDGRWRTATGDAGEGPLPACAP